MYNKSQNNYLSIELYNDYFLNIFNILYFLLKQYKNI